MKRLPFVIVVVAIVAGMKYMSERPSTPPPSEGASTQSTGNSKSAAPSAPPASQGNEKELPGGLKYEDFEEGKGAEVKAADTVRVHYTGWLVDNTKFDSSLDRGEPFEFTIGQGVIKGWSQGVPGMKVGGKRKLIIPPDLGYGAGGSPPTIPANATLVFFIELVEIKK